MAGARAIRLPALLCALVIAAGGCGGDAGNQHGARPVSEPHGTTDPNKDPFAASCEEILNSPDLYSQATVKLAHRVHLPDASEYHVLLRLRNAVTDICDKAGRGDYRPAREALRAVRAGKYKTARG
jgi:hypothetical protein